MSKEYIIVLISLSKQDKLPLRIPAAGNVSPRSAVVVKKTGRKEEGRDERNDGRRDERDDGRSRGKHGERKTFFSLLSPTLIDGSTPHGGREGKG